MHFHQHYSSENCAKQMCYATEAMLWVFLYSAIRGYWLRIFVNSPQLIKLTPSNYHYDDIKPAKITTLRLRMQSLNFIMNYFPKQQRWIEYPCDNISFEKMSHRKKSWWWILSISTGNLASYANVLRLVTRSSPRTSAQRTGHFRSLAVSLCFKRTNPLFC